FASLFQEVMLIPFPILQPKTMIQKMARCQNNMAMRLIYPGLFVCLSMKMKSRDHASLHINISNKLSKPRNILFVCEFIGQRNLNLSVHLRIFALFSSFTSI